MKTIVIAFDKIGSETEKKMKSFTTFFYYKQSENSTFYDELNIFVWKYVLWDIWFNFLPIIFETLS